MDWLRDQVRKGLNPRTYVLAGLLILVLIWIQSLDAKQKALRARASVAVATVAKAPATPASSKERSSEAFPEVVGWGRDPFERRILDAGEPGGGARILVPGQRARGESGGTGKP